MSNLTRLAPQPNSPKKSEEEEDPFSMTSLKEELPEDASLKETSKPQRNLDGCQWRVTSGLLNCMSSLADAYLQRGSPREALHFLEQSFSLSESIGAPAFACSALVGKAQIQLRQGNLDECSDTITQALECIPTPADATTDSPSVNLAELKRICGDFSARSEDETTAKESYHDALCMLDGVSTELQVLRRDRDTYANSVLTWTLN